MANEPKVFRSPFVNYVEVCVLGEGGAGRVYEVRAEESNERLALKVLIPQRLTRDKLKRFKNELAFCERERHARILRVLDYGLDFAGQAPFYVMPKYDHTLRTHMTRGIPNGQKLEAFSNLLDGVEAAHLIGVFHRDIKPENILCATDPTDLVLADFGIAHFESDLLIESVETKDASRLANFQYAAPEQRQRGKQVNLMRMSRRAPFGVGGGLGQSSSKD